MTGLDDITVPTLRSGREHPDAQGVVGFIADALLVRTSLAGNPTLEEVVTRVRSSCLEAFEHEAPIVLVADAVPDAALLLSDEGHASTLFNYIPHDPVSEPKPFGPTGSYDRVGGLPQNDDPEGSWAMPLDLIVNVAGTTHLVGQVGYNAALFDEQTVAAMIDGLIRTVSLLVEAPDTLLSAVTLA